MNHTKKLFSIVLACLAAACLIIAAFLGVRGLIQDKHSRDTLEELRASAEDNSSPGAAGSQKAAEDSSSSGAAGSQEAAKDGSSVGTADSQETSSATATPEPAPVPVVNPYRDSFLANGDMAAWLRIEGTVIDYPVMWTPPDETYYLYRDFDKTENKNGCLILDTDSCLNPLTTNLIIHGHNMKSGAMFGNLTDYESEAFYREHQRITLYTEELERNYEVIAVFRSQVYKKTDEVFKFYKFFQADTAEEFDDFYQNIKALSLYDTGITAEFGDHFLTLSTCVYHVEQGRFVVVAKEVESGDVFLPLQE